MVDPEITSDRILSIISDQWLTNVDIANKLGLEHSLDRKYLNIKLKELNRKEKVVYDFYNERVFWKYNNSETIEELAISFYVAMLDKDPFNTELWYKLGNQYLEWNWYMGDADADFYKIDIFTEINECYRNALRFVDLETEFKLYCDILLDLAMTYIMLEEPDKAQSQLGNLLEIKEELEEESIGRVYLELAQVYLIRDEYIQALDYAIKSNERIPNDYNVKMILRQIRDSIKKDQEMIINPSDYQELDDSNSRLLLWEILKEQRKSTKLEGKKLIISMKSYIDQSIKPFLEKPSNKKLKKLKNVINNYKEGWPDDMWESFVGEFHRRLELYKELQPSKWQKWGNILVKLISML